MQAFSMALTGDSRGNGLPQTKEELGRRGVNVYTASELVGITGRDKFGKMVQGQVEVPLFGLSVYDRVSIAQRCDAVFGVVSSRANRIAGLEWKVTRESKEEDRLESWLKGLKQIYDEYEGQGLTGAVVRGRCVRESGRYLTDLLPDMSNFDRALLRWHRRIQQSAEDRSTEIEDWLHEPNSEDDFEDFLKKWAFDLMVHGCDALYKQEVAGRLENLYHLPGGSVVPLKERFVSARRAFAQAMPGMDPKIYFEDEVTFSVYMPNSGISYGLIPLEALVNKVAETLFFDQRAAEAADGTRPPDKLVLFGDSSPFGATLTGPEAVDVPLPREEVARLETILNEPRKNAMRVLTGYGTPAILDLSRADTFQYQSERQRFVREATGFVFNMSNMEMNLTGSDDTSGRSTSEAQEKIEQQKGVYPMLATIQNKLNREVIPVRFGAHPRHLFKFQSGLSEAEQIELDMKAVQSKTWSVNERRIARGDEPWGPEYDLPDQQPSAPDGSEMSPFNMRGI